MLMTDIISYHKKYMQEALTQAQKAFDEGEVPIGAVIVKDGQIIARAYNTVERNHSQISHAELVAIDQAGRSLYDWRLEGCWIYVTLEPCAMCMNGIILSRAEGLVYAAASPLFGYLKVDKEGSSWLYKRDALTILDGICEQESQQLLKQFFKQKRVRE